MLISNQNPLPAERTLVTRVSGAHVGHSQPSTARRGRVVGGAPLFLCSSAILMSYCKTSSSSVHEESVFKGTVRPKWEIHPSATHPYEALVKCFNLRNRSGVWRREEFHPMSIQWKPFVYSAVKKAAGEEHRLSPSCSCGA